ncbi:MAG: leucyl/phenylalanyl-tRNA--protein transferase [Gammaproteobacteria bacterium]|nr:leucyl/phenylalanyl-tRNA--protein transferase [Gammaproteobacteria bacterium]
MPIPFLPAYDDITPFPPVEQALMEPNGLLMAGGNLSPARLLSAYRSGIFPWFEEGEPILWWSPDPRCVLWPGDIKIRRSLLKTIRKGHFRLSENTAFRRVMQACAAPRSKGAGTWITDTMIDAYHILHELGLARSIEVWLDEQLVGGLYGVMVGDIFVGESMFSRVPDASKVALVHLATVNEFKLIDCQLSTPHLQSMGAVEISREAYLGYLKRYGKLNSRQIAPSLDKTRLRLV